MCPPLLVFGPSFCFLAPLAAKSWRRACLYAISAPESYNVKHHHHTKHEDGYGKYTGASRETPLRDLKENYCNQTKWWSSNFQEKLYELQTDFFLSLKKYERYQDFWKLLSSDHCPSPINFGLKIRAIHVREHIFEKKWNWKHAKTGWLKRHWTCSEKPIKYIFIIRFCSFVYFDAFKLR